MAKLGKLKNKENFQQFIKKVQLKAPKRKPVRTKKQLTGTLFAKRNARLAIRQAALRKVTIVILYKKTSTNQIVRRQIIPLSYRFRKLKKGRRKVLFGLDYRDDKQVKYFVLRNIYKVALTDRKFKTRWMIQIE